MQIKISDLPVSSDGQRIVQLPKPWVYPMSHLRSANARVPNSSRDGFFPIAVWYETLDNIDEWVIDIGVNILVYNDRISDGPNDWKNLHQKVAAFRQKGYELWVIRYPGSTLTPIMDSGAAMTLDMSYMDQLWAYAIADEIDDKVPPGYWDNVANIVAQVTAQVKTCAAMNPDIPLFVNVNGSHVQTPDADYGISQKLYRAIANAMAATPNKKVILSQDNYPIENQQISLTGVILGKLEEFITGTTLLKQWTGYPTWVTIPTCNQHLHKAGDQGWDYQNSKLTFVGSRDYTVEEMNTMADMAVSQKADGIMFFPEAYYGGANNATPAYLKPVLKAICQRFNGPVGPATSGGGVGVGGGGGVPVTPPDSPPVTTKPPTPIPPVVVPPVVPPVAHPASGDPVVGVQTCFILKSGKKVYGKVTQLDGVVG